MTARTLAGLLVAALPGIIGIYVVAKGLGWFGKKEGLDPLAQEEENKNLAILRRTGLGCIVISVVFLVLEMTEILRGQ
jgi:hypothetical protein